MGINALTVQWLARLARAGVLPKGGSWVELGPQDFVEDQVTLDVLHHALDPIVGSDNAEAWKIFADPSEASATKTVLLYQCLGAGAYATVDLYDIRADFHFDLNLPFDVPRQFDVLTNFGTSEHCFNIAESFHACHRLLRAGGIGLYILPAFGDINHGFYNIHPVIYPLLADRNDYEIVEFSYVDDMGNRARDIRAHPHVDFNFATLPVDVLNAMNDKDLFCRIVMNNYVANCVKQQKSAAEISNVYDYCFVAMRKRRDATFVFPREPAPDSASLEVAAMSGVGIS